MACRDDLPGLASSRAGSLPQWICESIDFRDLTQNPVGASLLAKALGQALTLLDVPTLSEQARSYNGAGSLTTRNASTTSENAGDGWRRLG